MSKVIGLDVGTKTIGVALSDAFGWTAQGLETIAIDEASGDLGIDRLVQLIEEHDVSTAVIGFPKNMNNSVGPRGEATIHFSNILKERVPHINIVMWDERLSTVAAERSLLEADVSRKKRKNVIDKMAAVFILQGYLNSN